MEKIADVHLRPQLGGLSHLGAAIAVTAGTPILFIAAESPQEYVSATVFGASLVLVYWTSAAYHLVAGTPFLRRTLDRLDDSMVLVLIGGTYTPFCLLVLNMAWGISLLALIWTAVGIGVVINLIYPVRPNWFRLAFYVLLGWLALVPANELANALSAVPLVMLVWGGVAYTLGGVIYAVGKPNPWPQTFGYLEIFHIFVIAGSALHHSLAALYVL